MRFKMRSNSARRSEAGEQGQRAEICARCVRSGRQRQKERGRERNY